MEFGGLLHPGEPQPRDAKTANALQYERGVHVMLDEYGLDSGAQVLPGIEAYRMNLHGTPRVTQAYLRWPFFLIDIKCGPVILTVIV
ncbi:MAG: hypothetical protein V7606_2378 [Burkholderiales bacterium]|nr:hypothetical protein [Burkholderia sp.]